MSDPAVRTNVRRIGRWCSHTGSQVCMICETKVLPYARWSQVAERPENALLRLADIGARQVHYVYAEQHPGHYPGHSGGSMTCRHPDCQVVQAGIWDAVQTP